ncbi:large subunit of alpha-aminoadipate reductase [Coccidioides posadasii str. Silveira]|uniref:Alpha-aminoadipate reductase n=3 Tax=Coccidioides posadasii TaxID=199306 RepID=E9CW50_COCPS|nr:alpha-aminoadipate reductase large subunit, putative [Coccidioides posadasii C735 delta SOWgp]EER23582.1 alpha-aminoadipate reductase large subunit, putative [Coccidioides posadasii C735 delta SOWgp]EFW21526.1 alpha-aminoadipate reductase large subunit [Coccidioides posadasii str. Silveira]KMM65002.1 L-aminoadipate-semialdehyde dehydrogenase [Coccidioides posadasii RMSCC 3488]QVM07006.1 large subunit of alpha-aminoadipate reductase [Coccidioides posadasii str. Silveira]|eukprot:XP_003065727.1 alpha-aminoadipate reductase large subunit, putative [Coccidioides posadasii C735 delta SOWgp]
MGAEGASVQDRLTRWAQRLKNLTVSPLTRDYPETTPSGPDVSKRAIEAFESLKLSSEVQAAISKLSGPSDSGFLVFLTAFVVLVSRLTGDEDIALGTSSESDGRSFVLRVPISQNESFAKLYSRVSEAFAQGVSDIVPLRTLRTYIQKENKSERTPILFRFAAYEAPAKSQEYPANTFDTTDLVLNVAPGSPSDDGELELGGYYNQRLFSSARISTILTQLVQLIRNASNNPDEAIGRVEFLTESQRQMLPDPTKDLHWSEFRGAIQDIFARNAEKHPDKLCVVETKSHSSPQREFTYRQIHEASNILGHHLLQSRIQRGEVVMVYAHRGVDLVVAIMGILKAGATFSVIDPAYPPDRQVIYLDVARPRALINIEKATQDAGELTEKVRSFIDGNLELRTEIPALALRNDGSLQGGSINGNDVLQPQVALKAKPVGVVVGPDSTPTLSFTSGSEGRPKGVRGRHFSLAYYFPWMSKTFKLSENDRFTLLSGIAHDPVQRDIFTPLFLGAMLLVPSREDIQNEKLAEWMREYKATVTHLTPAMGQILVGGATAQFPSLHHAFFVGDILIKRDCMSLQALAPNVNIVNMYGTTETQRAVSYFEIPSYASQESYLDMMKDVIPAGKGMVDVQLLVVNRFDRTKLCAVGEVGEIYVRAGGLAEGYLGAPELNEKKFLSNWFIDPQVWKDLEQEQQKGAANEPWREFYVGPRDRLYRSGDLGRYTPTGEVECSGRADDQVKIRGFRIELGEIDTHLSRHPLVRENVTLVRRDKFEEPTLVSYIVPQMSKWASWLEARGLKDDDSAEGMVGMLRRFRPLREDAREYLRGKLPSYAVPTVIIPLKRMPLNPNGKVDKPALPFPDTAELSAAAPRRRSSVLQKLSETELALAQIWAKLIPNISARMIGPNDSFFDLGGHSILAQQMFFQLRRKWRNIDLSMSAIFRSPTLRAFGNEIARLQDIESFTSHDQLGDSETRTSTQVDSANEYSEDAKKLVDSLPKQFPSSAEPVLRDNCTVFLTGATGFLGAFVLRELLSRANPSVNVVALVRAKSPEAALERVRSTCQAYGSWSEEWVNRLQCVQGNLGDEKFGFSDDLWKDLTNRVDVVIHNGALVHWVYPYANLRGPNVLGTIDSLKLCAEGKAKQYGFVSSTSVLDTNYFVDESERIVDAGGAGISESDNLAGSSTGLGTGYGQSKWVGEYLVREAGRRGLKGAIIRPGYVTGDSETGTTNTDDFLVRMIKGCIQLSARPNINNTVNMVPVDHVARVVVASAFSPPHSELSVAHVTSHPRLRFNQFLGAIQTYGYDVPQVDYVPWASYLERYVNDGDRNTIAQHALMPLYHFVTADLPSNTRAPELDDANAAAALRADAKWSGKDLSGGSGVTEELIGLYLAYLVEIGFLPAPTKTNAKPLPKGNISKAQKAALGAVGGRGGLA